jgi:hypothetical protein
MTITSNFVVTPRILALVAMGARFEADEAERPYSVVDTQETYWFDLEAISYLEKYRQDSYFNFKLLGVGMGAYNVIYVCFNGDTLCDDCAEKEVQNALECGFIPTNFPTAAMSEAEVESDVYCEGCNKQLAKQPED